MINTEDEDNNTVGEKLCKHKYSSYPYCYGDITKEEALAGECDGHSVFALGIMLINLDIFFNNFMKVISIPILILTVLILIMGALIQMAVCTKMVDHHLYR